MYDQLASDYDRFVNWENRLSVEMPFLEQLLLQHNPSRQSVRVLDAACGTGMHALALAKLGYQVSGADFSTEMIAKARNNASAAGVDCRFEAAGFGKLARTFGKEQFNALLCLGNSLPHLLTQADLEDALSDFADCLLPGGVLCIQNRNFDAVMAKKDRWMEPQAFQEAQNEWLFQRFYDFEPNGLIRFNIVTLKRVKDADWVSGVTSTFLRPQLSADLSAALAAAKFKEIQLFGNMTGDSFEPSSSGNLILTARK